MILLFKEHYKIKSLKNSKPHQERKAITEDFIFDNTLPLLIKLILSESLFRWNPCKSKRCASNLKSWWGWELFEQPLILLGNVYNQTQQHGNSGTKSKTV